MAAVKTCLQQRGDETESETESETETAWWQQRWKIKNGTRTEKSHSKSDGAKEQRTEHYWNKNTIIVEERTDEQRLIREEEPRFCGVRRKRWRTNSARRAIGSATGALSLGSGNTRKRCGGVYDLHNEEGVRRRATRWSAATVWVCVYKVEVTISLQADFVRLS
jgi:hypothetical protein